MKAIRTLCVVSLLAAITACGNSYESAEDVLEEADGSDVILVPTE